MIRNGMGIAGLVVALLLISVPAVAQVQETDSPSFEEGLQAYFQENYEKARDSFERAVEESPDNTRYRFFLANTFRQLGQDTMAIQGYRDVISRDSSHESARRRLADLYYGDQQWEQAESHYRKLIEEHGKDGEVDFRLARSLYEQGELDEAKTFFLRAREKEPRRSKLYFYLGRILLDNGEHLNAASRFNRAIELDNTAGKYYFYRALAHFRQEDYLSENQEGWKSAADFQRAIDRGYESPRTHFMLGNSLLNRGLFLLKQDRQNQGIELLKKSIRWYRQVLAGEWKASNAYHNMGVSYLGIGKLDMARQSIEQAILIEPTTPFFHDTLGDVYFRQGHFGKAIDSWQLVKELDSDYEGSPFRTLLESDTISEKIKEARIRR